MSSNNLNEIQRMIDDNELGEGRESLAVIWAIRQVADSLERVVVRLDKTEEKIDNVATVTHHIDTRLTLMEKNGAKDLSEKNRERIDVLEKEISKWKTQLYTISGVIFVVWAVLGEPFQRAVSKLLGV